MAEFCKVFELRLIMLGLHIDRYDKYFKCYVNKANNICVELCKTHENPRVFNTYSAYYFGGATTLRRVIKDSNDLEVILDFVIEALNEEAAIGEDSNV